jgi:hypothetical protein
MLSQEIDHFQAAIIARADDMLSGKAGPMVMDAASLSNWAMILEGWIEQAMAMEQNTIAPAARIHPLDLAGGNVTLLADRRDARKANQSQVRG